MNRRSIPSFAMSEVGRGSLREEGIVVTTLEESLLHEPARLHPHYHDFFQVMLLRGRGAVMHDFRDYAVSGETLLFLAPGQVHTIRPRRGFGATIVSFTQDFFDHTAPPPSALLGLPVFFDPETAPVLPIPRRDSQGIARVFAEMQQEFSAADSGAADVLRAWLRILFARVMRLHALRRPLKATDAHTRLVREFRLSVERSFRERHTLSDYARELGVTADHLNEVVRERTGQPAGKLIRQRRLLDAKRLLSHSDLDIAEVGYQTGFKDPSYFGRFFRRETGRTPAEFRGEIREKYHRKPD